MIEYANKLCLAPMVRSGELPIRLLSLRYGCDLLWTPELVDKKILQSTRIINQELNTIDYIVSNHQQLDKKTVIFRKHPVETGRLILQLGSSDPQLAVDAARKVIDDVDGIDLNCGCPKNFSTHSGMGAELLKTPDKLCSILINLVEKIGIPNKKSISCKIRLFNNYDQLKNLIEKILQTGISNLTIHCRTPIMRNRQDPVWNFLPKLIPIIQTAGVNLVINGNMQNVADLKNLQSALNDNGGGKLSIMIAEAAEANPSVFSHSPKPQCLIIQELFEICQKYYQNFLATKFLMLNMIPSKSKYFQKLSQTKSFDQMGVILKEISQEYEKQKQMSTKGLDKIFTIMNRDCQKANFFNLEQFQKHIAQRGEYMTKFFHEWQESTMLEDFDDTPTKRPLLNDNNNNVSNQPSKRQKKKMAKSQSQSQTQPLSSIENPIKVT